MSHSLTTIGNFVPDALVKKHGFPEFEFSGYLGGGSEGAVFSMAKNPEYAIKIVMSEQELNKMIDVIKTEQRLEHLLYPTEIIFKDVEKGRPFYAVIYERLEMDLAYFHYELKNKSLSLVLFVIWKLWEAMNEMVGSGMCHGDFSEDNIMFTLSSIKPQFKFLDISGGCKAQANVDTLCLFTTELLEEATDFAESSQVVDQIIALFKNAQGYCVRSIMNSNLMKCLGVTFANIETDWLENYLLLKQNKYRPLWVCLGDANRFNVNYKKGFSEAYYKEEFPTKAVMFNDVMSSNVGKLRNKHKNNYY
jgi:hypothetical protein